MRRNFFKAAGIALASLFSTMATTAKVRPETELHRQEDKEVKPETFQFRAWHGDAKAYGQIFGTGGSKKSNRNRYSHNAKLKRRGVC